nr:SpaH/EbpB family LPXTG-anchored major pilin [uncultured Blautia sp.]
MKKFKKLLAGLLAGAMMLGSMSATAFAAQTTTPATIDTTKKGSLTIHKYEYNGNDTTHKGTGSENDTVPEGAKPLAGAGFTIYKVAGVDELTSYYSTNPTELPNKNTYVENGKIKSAYSSKKVGEEVKTGADGTATFTELELGFYVVIETSTPDKVTTPADPFLVSIPMTTAEGDNWLYDVHVYPKNVTTYGGVTLEKQGKTGNSTDTNPLSGVEFILQKKNGTGWTNVTKNESDNSDLSLVTNAEGKITVNGLSQGTYRFIETDRGNNDGYIMDGAKTYEFTVTSEGKITYGGKTDNNIKVSVTNEKPDMTKQVQDRTSGDWKQETDYNVGDMVPYQITVDVPSNITKLKEFTLTDTPTNLKDDITKVVVKCGESTLTEGTESEYTIARDESENGFKITFDTSKMAAYAGKQLVITYKAELLDTAVTTTGGNTNSAKLEYSNKILPDTDDGSNPNKPGQPEKDSIKNTTTVYTFGLQVVKKAENENGKALEGVQFDLYKEVPAGTTGAASAEEVTAAGLDSTKTWLKINKDPLTTNKKGIVSQSGLANGTYYLVEIKTHDGYNLLKAPVEVKLNIEYETTTKNEYYKDENGVKTLVKHEVTKTTFDNDDTKTEGIHTETIINKKGFTLPTTGGMGTIAITALGVALAFAGVLIIGASRKKTVK